MTSCKLCHGLLIKFRVVSSSSCVPRLQALGILHTSVRHVALSCTTKAAKCRQFKVFIISLSMGWIQQQKETTLNAKYKLPKMPYKGERITPQIMRMKQKSLVTEIGDVVEDPEFPLLTKRRPITVPGPPKGMTKVRPDSAQAVTSSSQAQTRQDAPSAEQTTPEAAAAAAYVRLQGRWHIAVLTSITNIWMPLSHCGWL